jgi:glycosyltransferase involved in cell wall biosynthesis
MAAGLPVVASPVGVNRSIVKEGETGFLARNEVEWGDALAALVASADLRRQLGDAGRRVCVARYDLRAWLPTLLGILESAAQTDRP